MLSTNHKSIVQSKAVLTLYFMRGKYNTFMELRTCTIFMQGNTLSDIIIISSLPVKMSEIGKTFMYKHVHLFQENMVLLL